MTEEQVDPLVNARRTGYTRSGFAARYHAYRPRPRLAIVDLLMQLAQSSRERKALADAGAAGADGGREPGRFSARRKTETILRLLRGESLDSVAWELGVKAATLAQWREQFLVPVTRRSSRLPSTRCPRNRGRNRAEDAASAKPKTVSKSGIPYLLDNDLAGPAELVNAIRARRTGGKLLNLDRILLHSPSSRPGGASSGMRGTSSSSLPKTT